MIAAICGTALYSDSNGEIPECKVLRAEVIEKVYPIPNASAPLHGFVVLVEDEVNGTFDGKYYIIVSNSTYAQYELNETFVETICSAEEYEKLKNLVFMLLTLDFITAS